MTGTTRTTEGLDPARRRALYRSWRRGTREMDLLMGRFADAEIDRFDEAEFAAFEALIEVPDRDLFAWIAEKEAVPANYDTGVFRRLKAFHEAYPTTEHIG
ncbi:succinate dehydrogenase assembly factor 2 [Hansschlegelia zhihuaiae]|uniref:FAD assembly factor SdhE n=1 Tax=Hansschlegelia zhihuaiae TaxID=405005 RepID=A0A4Q0MN44_9HYPH|nr:succinate dehydrogenase assembly factor 2 [Hansschlegelia zhihuaiae]RXF75033.1 succinate dehydrogenase assembly factor 2 [Hansschlegelia zhihuaiae]